MKKQPWKVLVLLAFTALSFSATADEEATPSTSRIGENAELQCTSESSAVAKGEEVAAPVFSEAPGSVQNSTGLGKEPK